MKRGKEGNGRNRIQEKGEREICMLIKSYQTVAVPIPTALSLKKL